MKKQASKRISLMLVVCILLSVFTPIPSTAADAEVELILTPGYLVKNGQAQTVQMTVRLKVEDPNSNYIYVFNAKSNDASVSVTTQGIYGSGMGEMGGDIDSSHFIGNYVDLCIIEYTVAAHYSGTAELYVENFQLYDNKANKLIIDDQKYTVSLNVYDDASQVPQTGYAASLTGPETATAGDSLAYTVTVTGGAFASAYMTLAYDAQLLEFDAGKSPGNSVASDGSVTLLDYGSVKADGYSYTLHFIAKTDGSANVTLQSAAFGTSQTAVKEDLTEATITEAQVTTVISKKSYSVTLPEYMNGGSTVYKGDTYSFSAIDANSNHYTYTVNATMGGQSTTVKDNGNGRYSIENVTGNLVIGGKQTAVQHQVTFTTNTGVQNLPTNTKATYGQDFVFTLPQEDHYTISITEATVGGKPLSCDVDSNGEVTISGTNIEGDIQIVIDRSRSEATVRVEGTGADAAGNYDTTAAFGAPYTLTLQPEANYVYTVSATMGGASVDLSENGNQYTINNVNADPIIFTVNKSVDVTDVECTKYLQLNNNVVWLIKINTNQLSGSVYTYNGQAMYWSKIHNAYCYLVIASAAPDVAADQFAIDSGTAQIISDGFDVNGSGKTDVNDAQLIYDLYHAQYGDFSIVSMAKFLQADVNGDGTINSTDAVAVVNHILKR